MAFGRLESDSAIDIGHLYIAVDMEPAQEELGGACRRFSFGKPYRVRLTGKWFWEDSMFASRIVLELWQQLTCS